MTRVATVPMHANLFAAIERAQQRLASSQLQMSTGKKAPDFAALGNDSARSISARSILARQEAQRGVAERLGTTLSLYDSHLSGIEQAAEGLRVRILEAVGTGRTTGLGGAIEEAFQLFRTGLNADEAGIALFAGARTGSAPFTPATLAETAGLPSANAFANDDTRASARVADGLDVRYGITASEVGSELFAAFRTLAEAGNLGDSPTPVQREALETAIGQLNEGLSVLRGAWGENGRRQAQMETIAARSEERELVLHDLISRHEDADMASVASDITRHKTVLEASYAVFARLSGLSLINYLR